MELDVSQPILLRPGEGEVISESVARRTEILCDHPTLVASWSRRGPRSPGASPHVHRAHSDLFYVLEGELTVLVGPEREERALPAGTLALAPPLVVHGFRNGSDEEVRYLNFHAPGGGFADYLRGAAPGFDSEEPPADGGRPVEDASIGTGEVVADRPGLRVALLADLDAFGICEVWSEPGSTPPPLHVHRRHTECFYVLAGELLFTADGQELPAGAGTWVHIPPGIAHTFAPTGSEEVRFLDIHAPSCGFGDFVRALHLARDDEELRAARAQFDQEPA